MSFGFHTHPSFRVVGAVDAQNGKPSSGPGTLECNKTYTANMGVPTLQADVASVREAQLRKYLGTVSQTDRVDVLISCAPCTGFSRTIRRNLVEDDPRNGLVLKSADFVEMFEPAIFLMENVGELLSGKFTHHFGLLKVRLESLGYQVEADLHRLEDFGLPQLRRRSLIVAAKRPLVCKSLHHLWEGYRVVDDAKTVRRAIGHLPPLNAGEVHPSDACHVSPSFLQRGLERLRLIPKNGGSWPDLLRKPSGESYLIPSMARHVAQGRVGPHPDIYGRMAWDRPAVTIKRECSSPGNGRYCHPEQDRLCTVRELAIIQGFPRDYRFVAESVNNMYRHIGDAVPPIISYQLAHLCGWILTGDRPPIEDILLPGTHLSADDVVHAPRQVRQLELSGAEA
jgi:DNA (cytosine-5)-methyltransferase 1